MCQISITIEHFRGKNLGLTGGKYFIKIIFDIKIEIGILSIRYSKFQSLLSILIVGPTWA